MKVSGTWLFLFMANKIAYQNNTKQKNVTDQITVSIFAHLLFHYYLSSEKASDLFLILISGTILSLNVKYN